MNRIVENFITTIALTFEIFLKRLKSQVHSTTPECRSPRTLTRYNYPEDNRPLEMCTANLFPSQTCLQALTLPCPGHPHHTAHAHSVPSSQALRYLSPHTLPPHILPQGVLSRRTKVPPAAPKPPGPALAGLWDSTCGCDIGP